MMSPREKRPFRSPEELLAAVTAFRPIRAILTGFELGIFTALGGDKKTSAAVARKVKADPRATDRLMNALSAIGLLYKRKGLFSNTSFAARYLVEGQPEYLAGLGHAARLWHSWSTLTRAVRRGGRVLERPVENPEQEKRRIRSFIASMDWRAAFRAPQMIRLLDLSRVRKTLDIGGGSGAFSVEMVKAKPDIRATIFDLPEVIPVARGYVAKAGLSSKFTFVAGDFLSGTFDADYDLILLSSIIHMNSASVNQKLFKKCGRSLNPGGQLVVHDWIMSRDRTKPVPGAIFALNMIVNTKAGDTYAEQEVRAWMRQAGLCLIRRTDTPFESSVMIGTKPIE
jgi:SAM-dependent methyltransferase